MTLVFPPMVICPRVIFPTKFNGAATMRLFHRLAPGDKTTIYVGPRRRRGTNPKKVSSFKVIPALEARPMVSN